MKLLVLFSLLSTVAASGFVGFYQGIDTRVATLAERSIIEIGDNRFLVTGSQTRFELCNYQTGVFEGRGRIDGKGNLVANVNLFCAFPTEPRDTVPVARRVKLTYEIYSDGIIAEIPSFRPDEPTFFHLVSKSK